MFPGKYFGARYYPPRYFSEVGADAGSGSGEYFGNAYFGAEYFGPFYWGPGAAAPPAVLSRTNWDTSDPLFYDWWRKRAKDEREKLEISVEVLEEAVPALRLETITAVEAATSIEEIQSLNLLKYERDILKLAIAEYQAAIDQDEEEAEFLLLH